ncbi:MULTISPECIES: RNA polymerase sigma factor [unclassified Mucilaginibacter]|uniref:RNA polymerase sigma factor n=1 Tax=unclassified Mucilaginibacter TaxID=2617802 RepID=UPI002AC9910A|nr:MULTISPECIES: RNA polymerase sigma factor [unclassified Mucilaginibacter]MEB0261451.1 RNA polymerase sigma factor [Mucilaginibacter sp. 10I4]MEB0276963.1 RNA polymerase sigma factor [Mucilaginibacter sp. 10B2]MEB0301514.1 RNA polymerase sigma factor [Mucilaginibacter sp. 5C4]WPX25063.1 RNA polymerase sigma factor [Mucilaginibacter sp. 5C4]
MHVLHGITEDEIVSKCKSGSIKHQELLYKQFYGYAMGVSMRYSLNQDDALEVANDAFIKVFNNIGTYNANKPFRAWLRTIVVNTAIDRRRKEIKHQANLDIEDAYNVGSNATAIDTLNAQDILKLMKQLPQIQLTIFNMYEIDGYNHDEIGKILNLPASSSRVYLSRAKDKLRQLLTTETQNHG